MRLPSDAVVPVGEASWMQDKFVDLSSQYACAPFYSIDDKGDFLKYYRLDTVAH